MRDISGVTMATHNGCKHWKIKDDSKRECYNPILNQ